MARWNLSLCCSPQPIARFMKLFPKLALIFLLVHVAAMIYSVLQPSPHALKSNVDKPPGVVDVKMRNIDPAEQHSDFKGLLNNGSEYNYKAEQKKVNSGRNDTKPGLLHRLNALKLKHRPET